MANPYVFLVGAPRSGTTLLQRIVDAHRQIAITPESHWIPSYFRERKGLTPEGAATHKLVRKLLAHAKFRRWGLGREDLLRLLGAPEPISFAHFVSALYDRYGARQGKPRVGDKTPGYARNILLLHQLWPAARFVHLIRDGRDVCLSAIHWERPGKLLRSLGLWQEDRVTTIALWWEWHVRLARQSGQRLPPSLYCEVRYEALVTDPAAVCRRLCAFLEIPYDEGMLRFHEKPARSDQTDHPWQPIRTGLRDWRSQLPREQVERFEAAAGPLLEELGYAQGTAYLQAEQLEYAARLRTRLTEECRDRGYLVPEHW
jgi:hypothetical protein